jgi:nucleotide-binding universal stress UspA family protein
MEQPRILCAVDGSTGSETAFSYGLAIAKFRAAQMDLVCAIPALKQLSCTVHSRGDPAIAAA